MGIEIFPVVLDRSNKGLIKRVELKEEYKVNKITGSDFAIKMIKEKRLFVLEGSLKIDNSSLGAKEVLKRIIEKLNNIIKLLLII